MEITRDEIVDHLETEGRSDDAGRARTELPESFDVENPPALLAELGIDAKQLLGSIGSGTGEAADDLPA